MLEINGVGIEVERDKTYLLLVDDRWNDPEIVQEMVEKAREEAGVTFLVWWTREMDSVKIVSGPNQPTVQ
jgi:hypothetical protein